MAPLELKTPSIELDAAGLVALADITTIQEHVALTGNSSLLDLFILVPGLHLEQHAEKTIYMHTMGENPACASLNSGYVFRVENVATVYYLQRVGRTGHLTSLAVTNYHKTPWRAAANVFFPDYSRNYISGAAYSAAACWGITVLILLVLSWDWWGVFVVGILILVRFINIVVMRRRRPYSWFGRSEPGVKGDLFILLSQDRFIRMSGYLDDLKAVVAGRWLRKETILERHITAFATVMVYVDAALVPNLQQFGKILILALMIGSAGLLALANTANETLNVDGRRVAVVGKRKVTSRLSLVEELIKESQRDDWAVAMGMIRRNAPS